MDSGAAEVARIHVAAGAQVAAGDLLVTLETPCVYVDVEVPRSRMVRSLEVALGDRVVQGEQLLVVGDVREALPVTRPDPASPTWKLGGPRPKCPSVGSAISHIEVIVDQRRNG
ncbi:biotin/lipoyl-containing protein [Ramlibacter sp. AN1133]|uniref:biotin/lipoyl-containing protein n=1 Tax=Ramlibacter sp. AN1133 TaxID=3133429 RepID=UPI0040407EBA